MEAQKITTKDRLNKVKDRFERELLAISLQLSEDKKMEMFMKTKHQDKTHYLRQMREKELQKGKTHYLREMGEKKLQKGRTKIYYDLCGLGACLDLHDLSGIER